MLTPQGSRSTIDCRANFLVLAGLVQRILLIKQIKQCGNYITQARRYVLI